MVGHRPAHDPPREEILDMREIPKPVERASLRIVAVGRKLVRGRARHGVSPDVRGPREPVHDLEHADRVCALARYHVDRPPCPRVDRTRRRFPFLDAARRRRPAVPGARVHAAGAEPPPTIRRGVPRYPRTYVDDCRWGYREVGRGKVRLIATQHAALQPAVTPVTRSLRSWLKR